MSTGDGRLQAELPGFVMVSWGHVPVAHTLHNVASLPRLCILHTWQREPLVPADTPLQNKRCLSRGAPFMIYHDERRAYRSTTRSTPSTVHSPPGTAWARWQNLQVARTSPSTPLRPPRQVARTSPRKFQGAEPRTCSDLFPLFVNPSLFFHFSNHGHGVLLLLLLSATTISISSISITSSWSSAHSHAAFMCFNERVRRLVVSNDQRPRQRK